MQRRRLCHKLTDQVPPMGSHWKIGNLFLLCLGLDIYSSLAIEKHIWVILTEC